MNFHKGDTVMHWTYGIGQIVNLEERALAGSKTIYYEVQVRNMTVWVPADSKVRSRLRTPTSKPRFQRLLAILSSPSEPLPDGQAGTQKPPGGAAGGLPSRIALPGDPRPFCLPKAARKADER